MLGPGDGAHRVLVALVALELRAIVGLPYPHRVVCVGVGRRRVRGRGGEQQGRGKLCRGADGGVLTCTAAGQEGKVGAPFGRVDSAFMPLEDDIEVTVVWVEDENLGRVCGVWGVSQPVAVWACLSLSQDGGAHCGTCG